MENPIIRIAATFKYKLPLLWTVAVLVTISWSRGRPHIKSCTSLHISCSQKAVVDVNIEKLVLKTVLWNVIIIVVVVVVDNDD